MLTFVNVYLAHSSAGLIKITFGLNDRAWESMHHQRLHVVWISTCVLLTKKTLCQTKTKQLTGNQLYLRALTAGSSVCTNVMFLHGKSNTESFKLCPWLDGVVQVFQLQPGSYTESFPSKMWFMLLKSHKYSLLDDLQAFWCRAKLDRFGRDLEHSYNSSHQSLWSTKEDLINSSRWSLTWFVCMSDYQPRGPSTH